MPGFQLKVLEHPISKTGLTILSGILFSLAFPGYSFPVLSFLFLIPLLYVIETSSFRQRFVYGAVLSCITTLGSGYWLMTAIVEHYGRPAFQAVLFFILFVILPVSFLTGTLVAVIGLIKKRNILYYLIWVPSCWVLFEYTLEIAPMMIPWALIGYALVPWTPFIQLADVTGVYGISYIIVAINAIFWSLIKIFSSKEGISIRRLATTLLLISIFFSLPFIYGTIRLSQYKTIRNETAGQQRSAVIVQGSFSLEDRWSGFGFRSRLASYLDLTEQGISGSKNKTIVVWPETMLNEPAHLKDGTVFSAIRHRLGKETVLITGGLRPGGTTSDYFNTACIISDDNTQWYDKRILLPYAEYAPLGIMLERYYHAPSAFLTGSRSQVVKTVAGTAGLSICFESVYPEHLRASVRGGAEYLVNISNDSWFSKSGMPEMHLNIAAMRAVENRRYLLRSSNSGISAVIAPTGLYNCKIDMNKRKSCSHTIQLRREMTLFTRLGNLIVLFASVSVAFFLVLATTSGSWLNFFP